MKYGKPHFTTMIFKMAFGLFVIFCATNSYAKSIEDRLDLLERKVSGKLLLELSSHIQQLQAEVRQLKGDLEVVNMELNKLKTQQQDQFSNVVKKQKELYSDIDRRLYKLEVGQERSVNEPIIRDSADKGVAIQRIQDRATVHSPATQDGTDFASEVSAYKSSFELLREGNYQQAAERFQKFIELYPTGKYADNAQYWLGEANYVTRKFTVAKAEFEKVIQNYPSSQKISDAMLKIGFIHYEKGEWEQAKTILGEIGKKFPYSTAANLAKKRLMRITREGN